MSRARRTGLLSLAVLLLAAVGGPAWSDPPVLYSNPTYESPFRGAPGELLLLPGSGLAANAKVVYAVLGDTTVPTSHPSSVPLSSNSTRGVADLVSAADAPYSLTVHLPTVMLGARSYGLWVLNGNGEWSNGAVINDARPQWITPDFAYRTATLANLPRVLKVVGRNLQPGAVGTQVRLTGVGTGTVYTLPASDTIDTLNHYVAAVNLPATMVVDTYTVQLSRDGLSWVSLLGDDRSPVQTFTVKADPVPTPPARTFNVSDPRFADPTTGPCQPNDDVDDTGCILLAIRAAQAAGGGDVVFGPGKWLMDQADTFTNTFTNRIGLVGRCTLNRDTCGITWYGMVVPVSVNLTGSGATGANPTVIDRGIHWPQGMSQFVLLGGNTVSGIQFTDDTTYVSANYSNTQGGAPLALGLTWYRANFWVSTDPTSVSNVVITNNLFSGTTFGIRNGGLPAHHIYITNNTFGAWDTGIWLEGADEANSLGTQPAFPFQRFELADTVIAFNNFYPSGYTTSGGGPIATNIGGGRHFDFSNNSADGSSLRYIKPGQPPGWRAAFFMYPAMGDDMTLVSNNTAKCTGDKPSDGEFIVYDQGGSLGGMPYAEPVVSAARGTGRSTLTVQGTIITTLHTDQTIDISSELSTYYAGDWLHVLDGMGKGQWRRVETVSTGSNAAGPTVTLTVTPGFDVLPDASSQVILGRGYWQNATVNNTVDQRTPTCTKANPNRQGGVISWYASAADSAIEGNLQYDTSGIFVRHAYVPGPPFAAPYMPEQSYQSSNQIRNNVVNGAYDWSSTHWSAAGIQFGYAAQQQWCQGGACIGAPPPPSTGFDMSIAGNTVINAAARDLDGNVHPPIGAIGLNAGWLTGPVDPLGLTLWPLGDSTLVFNNTMQGISNGSPGVGGGAPLVVIGVDIALGTTVNPAVAWRTILFNNSCAIADVSVSNFGIATQRYCPNASAGSCECADAYRLDVGITARSSASSVAAGNSVTYTVTVINNDPSMTASDVNLTLAPSAGVQVSRASFNPSQGTCDSSVNLCMLGSLPAGQSVTVSVSGALPMIGTWPVTFSVSHGDADSLVSNDSVTVTELVH
jgi:hypothetical protein